MGRVFQHILTTLSLLSSLADHVDAVYATPPSPQVLNVNLAFLLSAFSTITPPGKGDMDDPTSNLPGLVNGLLNVTLGQVSDVLNPNGLGLLQANPLAALSELMQSYSAPNARDPQQRGWIYFGCFYAGTYLAGKSPKPLSAQTRMTPEVCVDACIADAMDFASIQGSQCYCSNTGPDHDQGTDTCNLACPGNEDEFCGSDGEESANAVSVYKRVISINPLPTFADPTNWQYNGCFRITSWISLLVSGQNAFISTPGGPMGGKRCCSICDSAKGQFRFSVVAGASCICTSVNLNASMSTGDGECAKPCTGNPGESCGGKNSLGNLLGAAYTRDPSPPSNVDTIPGIVSGHPDWNNWGCNFGDYYLLDTILTGFQYNSLLEPSPDMSGPRCVDICIAANKGYKYAMTVGGVCFCNTKGPGPTFRAGAQLLCNSPCPKHPLEPCGGQGSGLLQGRSLISLYGMGVPGVRGISLLTVLLLCSSVLCSVLCDLNACFQAGKYRICNVNKMAFSYYGR